MAARAGSCWPSQLDTMWSIRFGHPPRLREVEMAVSGLGPVTSSLRLCDGEHLHPVDAPALGFGHYQVVGGPEVSSCRQMAEVTGCMYTGLLVVASFRSFMRDL